MVSAQIVQYPDNIFADSSYAPFHHSVASGDPLPTQVIIWTRITPDSANADPITLTWEMATDANFTNPVQTGTFTTDATRDWTAKIDVAGLSPNTTYYYRFESPQNVYSRTGRTKTATMGSTDNVKFAVASCSSIYSGYFNAYGRIAERADLNAVIHLGDYIYDFVDQDEEVRVPDPYPTEPDNLEEWRDRHEYYLLDPDLRSARQMHPWIVIWDNHDVPRDEPDRDEAIQAFYEWIPIREDTAQFDRAYRKLSYGDLLDLFIVDELLFRDVDTLSSDTAFSMLGYTQDQWIRDQLLESTATWKFIGSQKLISSWTLIGVPDNIPVPIEGDYPAQSTWDGYFEARDSLYAFLDRNNIENLFVLSGDLHFSIASELTPIPVDTNQYNYHTGENSLGVELMASSITRGNLNETANLAPFLVDIATQISTTINYNHQFQNLVDHGYGVVDIKHDSAMATFWYSDILNQDSTEEEGTTWVVLEGDNHWRRPETTVSIEEDLAQQGYYVSQPIPNPSKGAFRIELQLPAKGSNTQVSVSLYNLTTGQTLHQFDDRLVLPNTLTALHFNAPELPTGIYGIRIQYEDIDAFRKWVKVE